MNLREDLNINYIREVYKAMSYRHKIVAFIVLAAMFVGTLGGLNFTKTHEVKAGDINHVTVENADGTKTIFAVQDGINTELISYKYTTEPNEQGSPTNYLVLMGKHVDSNSNIYYYTKGYNFTLEKVPTRNIEEDAGDRKKYIGRVMTNKADEPLNEIDEDGNLLLMSYYYLPLDTLENYAKELLANDLRKKNPGKSDAYYNNEAMRILAQDDGATIYMSNVFQIRQGPRPGSIYNGFSDIQNCDDMLSPGGNSDFWNPRTEKKIPSYYNIPIEVNKTYCATYKIFTNDVVWATEQLSKKRADLNSKRLLDDDAIASLSAGDDYIIDNNKTGDEFKFLRLVNPAKDTLTYTRVNGSVTKHSFPEFEIDGKGKFVFDGTLSTGDDRGITYNYSPGDPDASSHLPAMYYVSSNGTLSGRTEAGAYGSGLFQVFSRMKEDSAAKVGVLIDAVHNYTEAMNRVVILPFTTADNKNKVTVKYVTIGDDGKVTPVKTDSESEGLTIEKGKNFTYTLDEKNLIQAGDKSYSIVTDAKYPSKYVYGKASDTKYDSTNSIGVNRTTADGKITFETKSAHNKDSDATLYIPVELSTGKTYSVVYVSPSGTVITNLLKAPAKKGETYTFNALDNPPAGGIDKLTGKAKYVYGANPKYSATGDNVQDVSVPKGSTTYTFTHKQNKNATLFVEVDGNPPPPTGTESGTVNYWDSEATGVLISDIFDTPTAIPSTEEMYAKVDAANYLIKVGYKKVTGKKAYPITVTQPYTLIGENPAGEPTETAGSVSSTVTVEREFEYTELTSIDYYKLDTADIRNGAMEPTAITIRNMNAAPPSASHEHYASESNHVMDPTGLQYSITLPNIECDSVPDMSGAQSYAEAATGQLRVRNDYMTFGGATVLNNSWVEKTAPAFNSSAIRKAPKVTIRQDNLIIPATRENKVYGNRSYLNNYSGREGGSYVAKNKRKSHSLCEG